MLYITTKKPAEEYVKEKKRRSKKKRKEERQNIRKLESGGMAPLRLYLGTAVI